jgi:hypothetical protein
MPPSLLIFSKPANQDIGRASVYSDLIKPVPSGIELPVWQRWESRVVLDSLARTSTGLISNVDESNCTFINASITDPKALQISP